MITNKTEFKVKSLKPSAVQAKRKQLWQNTMQTCT